MRSSDSERAGGAGRASAGDPPVHRPASRRSAWRRRPPRCWLRTNLKLLFPHLRRMCGKEGKTTINSTPFLGNGAVKRTRTSTPVKELAPQASASTSSAMTAFFRSRVKRARSEGGRLTNRFRNDKREGGTAPRPARAAFRGSKSAAKRSPRSAGTTQSGRPVTRHHAAPQGGGS